MDRIGVVEEFHFHDLEISSQFFADDAVLLVSPGDNLQLALGESAAECKVPRMRISTYKSEAVALSWKIMKCPLQVIYKLLPQGGIYQECQDLVHKKGVN